MEEDATGRPSGRRVTVDEAARELGLSVDAIRKRVQRGTVAYEKDAAGRVRIILDSPDNTSTLRDESPDSTGREELVEELRDRIRSLERRLDEERDARTEERRRYDTVIAQLSQASAEQARTIRELEAPRQERGSEPREFPVSPTEASEGVEEEPRPAMGEAHGAAERPSEEEGPERSWWRRFFGF